MKSLASVNILVAYTVLVAMTSATSNTTDASSQGGGNTDWETLFHIQKVFQTIVTPTISLIGILGNLATVIVLLQCDIRKSSNILLLTLAIADILFLVGFNNAVMIVMNYDNFYRGLYYSEPTAYILYVVFCILTFLDFAGSYCSLMLPVCITLERLIAVFLPLKFSSIVTTKRTVIVVVILMILCLFFGGVYSSMYVFEYYSNGKYNLTRGLIYFDPDGREDMYDVVNELGQLLTGVVPLCLVLAGCVLIGIKVNWAARKRLALTSSTAVSHTGDGKLKADVPKRRTGRTTRTLLSVCVVYSLTNGAAYVTPYLLGRDNVGLLIRYVFIPCLLCINSSCNFIIYVVMNKNFRDIYRSTFLCCFNPKKK